MSGKIKVTVWNENRHEQLNPAVKAIYPSGIHGALGDYLETENMEVTLATLDDVEHGLTEQTLQNTDVLIWWGHLAHAEVSDEIVNRVHKRVLEGMGFIVLHSGHHSKIFKQLMGTTCDLKWREADEKERLWVVKPSHSIVQGIGDYIELPEEEMYGEFFDIPEPEELIFLSWFAGGEVFRSGCTYTRGMGKIFYFRPGHETYPTYHNQQILKVISNAVKWAKPTHSETPVFFHPEPVKPLELLN